MSNNAKKCNCSFLCFLKTQNHRIFQLIEISYPNLNTYMPESEIECLNPQIMYYFNY